MERKMMIGKINFLKKLYRQVIDDRCPQIAASLAYASLLALIPLTVLVYKIFSSAAVVPEWQIKVQTFVFDNLSPTFAGKVRQYLFDTAVQADGINILGIMMLLISVVIMMYTIDNALNSIWKIHKPRYLFRRVVVYLAILIFGPLAVSISLFVSAYLASLPFIAEWMDHTQEQKLFIYGLPFIISLVAFTMLYKWVPDRKVKWQYALSGGFIAACIFEIAKSGFALYANYLSNYELLYGTLASIPLLLIWIYLTWLTVLIGAEVTYMLEQRSFVTDYGW